MAPGEQLVDTLDELKKMLNGLEDRLDKSGVTRTNGLRLAMGRDCEFYKRSLDLFLRRDYVALRDLVKSCNDLFSLVEGKKPNGQG